MVCIEDVVEQLFKQYIRRHIYKPLKFIKLDDRWRAEELYFCRDMELTDDGLIFEIYPMYETFDIDDDYVPKFSIVNAHNLDTLLYKKLYGEKRDYIQSWLDKPVKYNTHYLDGEKDQDLYMCKNDYRKNIMCFYIKDDMV